MVALRRPDELPPPPEDGLPTRSIKPHTHDKLHYWGCYLEAASTALKRQFPGVRVCADLFASFGVCADSKTGERCWGSALLSLQVAAPFDLYFFNDINPEATKTLAARARALALQPYRAPADQLWALEQALRSGTCNAVIAWPPPSDIRTQRRLQLAAETGGAAVFFFYLEEQTPLDSFAALRLHVEANAITHKVHVKILKCRGERADEAVDVALTHVMADYATRRKRGR